MPTETESVSLVRKVPVDSATIAEAEARMANIQVKYISGARVIHERAGIQISANTTHIAN